MNTAAYHNTTGMHGAQLQGAIAAAESQDALILQFLRNAKGADGQKPFGWTPSEIHERSSKKYAWPITSIRRSLNTLCKEGHAVKLAAQKISPQGRPEHYFQAIGA